MSLTPAVPESLNPPIPSEFAERRVQCRNGESDRPATVTDRSALLHTPSPGRSLVCAAQQRATQECPGGGGGHEDHGPQVAARQEYEAGPRTDAADAPAHAEQGAA